MSLRYPCGSELARDGIGSSATVLTDTPQSRASSLPQDLTGVQILGGPG
ncbi:hypothetical protein AK973_5870 [Pseudomonas brassicacearum]|nr:hypothetical protein AK973_5870 [Pseudomonas brassicacearum]